MKFTCKDCGTEMDESMKTCPVCDEGMFNSAGTEVRKIVNQQVEDILKAPAETPKDSTDEPDANDK